MKNQKGFIQIPLLIAIIISAVVLVVTLYAVQSNKERSIERRQDKRVADTELSAADVAREWKDRVAEVVCVWTYEDRTGRVLNQKLKGSAILVNMSVYGGVTAVTNKHVIIDDRGNQAKFCVVGVYGKGSRTAFNVTNTFHPGPDEDYGFISLRATTSVEFDGVLQLVSSTDEGFFDNVTSDRLRVCTNEPDLGDKVLILGYPTIGTNLGITATEGIVSGIEEDHYVTSAKIDYGNSGGAAILLKDNCYLGIPTYAINVGGFESLGRILKGTLIFTN